MHKFPKVSYRYYYRRCYADDIVFIGKFQYFAFSLSLSLSLGLERNWIKGSLWREQVYSLSQFAVAQRLESRLRE